MEIALYFAVPVFAVIALLWVWGTPQPARIRLTITLLVIGAWLGFAIATRERVIRPLLGSSAPARSRTRVDLPAPLMPRMA